MAEDTCCEGQRMCCSKSLGMVEIGCANCGRSVYIFEDRLREKIFCTIKCMEEYSEKNDMTTKTIT